MTRVLVVEDEESFREGLQYMLSREGFEVILASDGAQGMAEFDKSAPDLVLLDWMLPEFSGIEVCKYIRTKSSVPVIMLTAKDTEVDKVVGLELGADDYVTKPFSTAELLARIRAVLRRGGDIEVPNASIIENGPIRIDVDRHTISLNGEAISMPLKEFELLEYLMRNSGRVLTRGQLMDRVWGSNYHGDGKTLDVHIKRIRSKIEPDPASPIYLTTVRGLGYRFES
ncbi:MAG: response regulator transcription factor [Actinobacteria bacterium]|nr:response regulator transcription factor [Actinomycetota bacterium]